MKMLEYNNRYTTFWIRALKQNIIEYTCDPSRLNNICVNDKPNLPFDITPVFFKREVLIKYQNSPHKYSVRDGHIHFLQEGIYLRVDTDIPDYVAVLLVDLSYLDYEEQLYWRSYNIKPNDSTNISIAAYNRWYEGKFAQSSAPDAILVEKYTQFYRHWYEHIGWHLFKENPDNKKCILYSLHLLTDENNEKEFYEQILVVTKLFIDSLNVKHLPKLEENENKSLNRLNSYLTQNNIYASGAIEFLRNIQRLRSTKAAHLGEVEKNVSRYFKFDEFSYGLILGNIFATLVQVINDLTNAANYIAERNKYSQ
jgi:hypothetical protein